MPRHLQRAADTAIDALGYAVAVATVTSQVVLLPATLAVAHTNRLVTRAVGYPRAASC